MENTETTQCSLAKLRLNNNSNFVFGRILTVMGDPSHLPGFTDLLNNPTYNWNRDQTGLNEI